MKDLRKLPWARLTMCLAGILVIQGSWRWAVNHLYSLPPEALAAFQAITTHTLYTVAALVVLAITGKLIWDWKNASMSAAETVTEVIREKREHIAKAEHFDGDDIP